MRLLYFIITGIFFESCQSIDDGNESDGDASRKILGSSVVTSVSVVMDTGNKKNTIFTDAVGKPQSKPSNPSELASPIDLLNPDRYEFYTFDDNGDLVKRLMSLEEIKSIIARGDTDALDLDSFTAQGFLPERRVNDVVSNVQSVLKEEMEILKDPISKPIFDTPDVSDSWSMILPAIFGNSGEDIKPEKPVGYVTPDTIMLEPNYQVTHSTVGLVTTKKPPPLAAITKVPTRGSTVTSTPLSYPVYYSSPTLSTTKIVPSTTQPSLNVEISSNGVSTNINVPSKETSTEMYTTQKVEPIPTRVTISQPTNPPLVRNVTTSKPLQSTSTRKTVNNTQRTTVQSTSLRPTTTRRASTNSRPTSTQLDDADNHKISVTPPNKFASTTSSVPNLFGFPPELVMGIRRTSTTLKPTKSPPSVNIFGFPYPSEQKTNPTTTPTPSKSTSAIVSSTWVRKNPISSNTTAAETTTWAPNGEDIQVFNIFKEVLSQSATGNIKKSPSSSETDSTDSTSITDLLNFESNKIYTTKFNGDLSTLPTTTTDSGVEDATTKLPSILHSLNDKQKLSASELLDQLLLTTNIYEINTELGSSKHTADSSTLPIQDSEQQTTTTDHVSYPPTTDVTLIHSIEQLLSQAVGDVQDILKQTTASTPPLQQSESSHTIINISKEAEMPILDVTVSTTESEFESTSAGYDFSTSSDNDNISTSVEAIVSQVNDHTSSLNPTVFTEQVSTEVTEENSANASIQTPIETQESKITTEKLQAASQEAERESTTIFYVLKKNPNVSTTNITQNQNRTKPAKSDLSLEQEIDKEEIKIFTLLQNRTNKTAESEKILNKETSPPSEIATTQTAPNLDTTAPVGTEVTGFTTEKQATTNDFSLAEEITTESVESTNTELQSSTIQYSKINTVPKSTTAVANNTISRKEDINTTSTSSPIKLQNNSTQDQTWTLVSTLAPQHSVEQNISPPTIPYPEVIDPSVPVDLVPKPMQGFGLEESTASLDVDVHQFAQLCNELAFGLWKTVTTGLSAARSLFVSPFAATSMLAMVFLGAKGATSEEMNEILKLDDMVTFNPHLTFKSVSESLVAEPNSGIATTAIVRELFSDRSKGKLLDFYKNRVRAFYDGFAEEVGYREIGDVIRRRTNLLVKKYTNGKYPQFLSDASIVARPPLSGIGINIFETDCSQTSSEGRDGELHFIVFPSMKQRRLIPIPAVVYKSGFLAGYEPSLDATAVSLGGKDQTVSTILVIPGQQGISVPGDGLVRLEKRLVESSFKKGAWSRLLRSLIPRPGLEVQIPRFSHRSVINATNTLQRMGLHELFSPESADLRGLNGVANELHLSDVLQINKFATCGEKRTNDSHHSEVYPATTMRARSARRLYQVTTQDQDEPRDYQRAFHDPLHDPSLLELPLSLRPRQARIPDVPRLRFDRPFLYFVRHNPTGLILHIGRFNPRLLP